MIVGCMKPELLDSALVLFGLLTDPPIQGINRLWAPFPGSRLVLVRAYFYLEL